MRLFMYCLSLSILGCSGEKEDGVSDTTDTTDTSDTSDTSDTTDTADTGDTVEPPCPVSMNFLSGETLQPSVIRLFFTLEDCNGLGVTGKTEEDFVVSEDGTEISIFESSQQLIPSSLAYDIKTLLLLDMSGSIVQSGNLPQLQAAARQFVGSVSGSQSVGVFAFDGAQQLYEIVDFTNDSAVLEAGIDGLTDYVVQDNSTNLNGAVIYALDELALQESVSTSTYFQGSLVVFTDGTDQAGWNTNAEAVDAVTASSYTIYGVGLGGEVDQAHLAAIGEDGSWTASNVDELSSTFEELSSAIISRAESLYILAYCSPKRNGEHVLDLELVDEGLSLSYTFDATGFESGCNAEDFVDSDLDGFRPYDGDCDDNDPTVYPGAAEICDNIDNDCDSQIDEGLTQTYYADSDSDGYGNPAVSQSSCGQPSGYVTNAGDCDDTEPMAWSNAIEQCDSIDNDCDGQVDEDVTYANYYTDSDGDGYGLDSTAVYACLQPSNTILLGGDCDDTNPNLSPGEPEVCDYIDNDCDNQIDEGALTTYYLDNDGDGFGTSSSSVQSCSQPSGYVSNADDCDDGDITLNNNCFGSLGLGNGETLEMVLIPAGTDPLGRYTLSNDFYLMTTEVTQGMFQQVMGYDSRTGQSTTYGDGADFPAYYSSWHMAAAFANAVTQRHNTVNGTSLQNCYSCSGSGTSVSCSEVGDPYQCTGYVLPTEAEWEYAARSGTTSDFWTGDGSSLGGAYSAEACNGTETIQDGVSNPLIGDYAWYCGNNSPTGVKSVAQKLPNGFGLYDMHGNLYEWTTDWTGCFFPQASTDPYCGSADSYRVGRGGGWGSGPVGIRASDRSSSVPADRFYIIGFRLGLHP